MKKFNVRWQLVAYDFLIFILMKGTLLWLWPDRDGLQPIELLIQTGVSFACIFGMRLLGNIYQQIWRYGGIQCYIRLLAVDGFAFLLNYGISRLLPVAKLTFFHMLSVACMNLLCALAMRMAYRYAYKCANRSTSWGNFLHFMLRLFAGSKIESEMRLETNKIKIAIIGAGRVGVSLAEELMNNRSAAYIPQCFVDVDRHKADREIHGIPVLLENEAMFDRLKNLEIQEVVFAVPSLEDSRKKELYQRYVTAGYKVKVYDFPVMHIAGGKRHLRDFDIEELLFRKPVVMRSEKTNEYYRDKIIMVTGGGGSIGSELCRQVAKMHPAQIIIVDICENGAYDIQQELRIAYGGNRNVQVEIASVSNRRAMKRIFEEHRPQIVIHAAAHKHVPLMERNCIEAVENNVFGTKIVVELCEEYGAERFMMVSTDKAVNPTNVMGATKRMCEMIVQGASTCGKVKYSATRFGNVLGSAGSVIPLFKKQIAAGGPITLTDKRIIRYFMTIPEASQLVLQSGAMADNGELFVLDMGQPVRILDLAENMIRLSGVRGVEIVETGLRPGEKLYEELLVDTQTLTKTENKLIFIERDVPLAQERVDEKLAALKAACETQDDDAVRMALHEAVPTYKTPEEVNAIPTELKPVHL